MSDLERIGKLILYRNKILEKILRELQKEFPSMDILLEEFVRLLEAIDDLDNDVIATIARLKEEVTNLQKSVSEEKDVPGTPLFVEQNLDEWLASILNSLDGSDSMKNYLRILNELGGVSISAKIKKMMGGLTRQAIIQIEQTLEEKGIIKSILLGDRKIVYFNHPKFTGMSFHELQKALEKSEDSIKAMKMQSKVKE